MLPCYLADQNIDYIKARGFNFRDFSQEQIIAELRQRDIRVSLHRTKNQQKEFKTISDNTPNLSNKTRWCILENPFTNKIYRCVRIKKRIDKKNILRVFSKKRK